MEPQPIIHGKRNKWHSKKRLIESPTDLSEKSSDVSSASSYNPNFEDFQSPENYSVPKIDTLIAEEVQESTEEAKDISNSLDLAEDSDIYPSASGDYPSGKSSAPYFNSKSIGDLPENQEFSADIHKIQFNDSLKTPARIPPTKGYSTDQKLNLSLKPSFEEYKLSAPLYPGENTPAGSPYAPKCQISPSDPKEKSKYSMAELKKDPELYKKAYEEALRLERVHGRDYTYVIGFNIQYNTQFGDKIVVTGGHEMLGNWDPQKGLELEWNPGNIWSATIHVGEGHLADIEFKYVCLQGTGTVRWEGGFNRKLKVSEGKPKGEKLIFDLNDIWQR